MLLFLSSLPQHEQDSSIIKMNYNREQQATDCIYEEVLRKTQTTEEKKTKIYKEAGGYQNLWSLKLQQINTLQLLAKLTLHYKA